MKRFIMVSQLQHSGDGASPVPLRGPRVDAGSQPFFEPAEFRIPAGVAHVCAGIEATTPSDPQRHGASVCVNSCQAQLVVDRLCTRGIYAWNGRGRIRFSFHGFNSMADVDRIIEGMEAEWRLWPCRAPLSRSPV